MTALPGSYFTSSSLVGAVEDRNRRDGIRDIGERRFLYRLGVQVEHVFM